MLIGGSWLYALIWGVLPYSGFDNWSQPSDCVYERIFPQWYIACMATHFVLIAGSMTLLYSRLWYLYRKREQQRQAVISQQNNSILSISRSSDVLQRSYSEQFRSAKLAKMLALVTGIFIVSWTPFFVITGILAFQDDHSEEEWMRALSFYSATFGIFNSAVNPLIYAWKNNDFREAFKHMLCCK